MGGCICTGRPALLRDMTTLSPTRSEGAGMGSEVARPPSRRDALWAESADLFRRWRAGDGGALDALVRTLSPVLWHVVRAYGLDEGRAQDVVQSTWLTFVRRQESISEPQAVGAWLTTTARREAWRTAKADGLSSSADDSVLEASLPTSESAEARFVESDDQDRLWNTVHLLSPRCQRLMRIIAFDPRPDYRSIAEELEMPVGSIGPTRGRCLAKLKQLLSVSDPEVAS